MLLETVLALVILSVAGLAVIAMLQKAEVASFKARDQLTCGRLADASMTRLKNMDFYDVFAVDSSSPSYGGLHSTYPYFAVLDGIKSMLAQARYDRFTTSLVFLRRDTTDSNHNGMTDDLVPFQDNGHGCDVYEPNICFYDHNGDGDYFETYSSGTRTVSELPDTHIKQVTLSIYRRGALVCSRTERLSLEQFTGAINPDSEDMLSLLISTPANDAQLFSLASPGLAAAQSLPIANAYPATAIRLEADGLSALTISGQTEPLATVNFSLNGGATLESAMADSSGDFSLPATAVTAALSEGFNTITAQAVKNGLTSPIAAQQVLLDLNPPSISGQTPSGTVDTLSPYIAATLTDTGASTATASGICPDVISMTINGSSVAYTYDSTTGIVVAVDSTTGASLILSTGVYTAHVETGDYAGYKSSSSWTFIVSVPLTDNSAPSISNKSPIGGSASSDLPVVSVRVFDNQSGIDPLSIVMTFDGATVVSSSNIGTSYDPASGTVSWTPPSPLASGSYHTVTIAASHWATSPTTAITSTDSWGFTAP